MTLLLAALVLCASAASNGEEAPLPPRTPKAGDAPVPPRAAKPEEDASLPRPAKGQAPEYYAALAKVNAAFGLVDAAETLQLKAIELEPDKAKKERLSFELFDQIYCRARLWDKAAQEILRTISLVDENNVEQKRRYHSDRARALTEAGRADESVAELETVARLSETDDEKQRALRALHAALKRIDKLPAKIAEYEAAVKKDPKDEVTLRILADIYYGSGLLDLPGKAIEKYEQIRAFKPDDINALEHLARLYAGAAKLDAASGLYERLLKLKPDRFDYYFNDAASLLAGTGKDADVVAWCAKIAREYPKEPAVPVKAGSLLAGLGQNAKAAEQYRTAIELSERYTDKLTLYFRLIESLTAAQQHAEAEAACRDALKLDIRSSTVREKLKDLLNKSREAQGKTKEQ